MAVLRKIAAMHALYGIDNMGRSCGQCDNMSEWTPTEPTRKYYKCSIYGETASAATDWRLKYLACGHINKPMQRGHKPVIEALPGGREADSPIDGQVNMFKE